MLRSVPPGAAALEDGARHLRGGRLVAFPTETVYGLGAVATIDRAVAAIFAAKGRPANNPLIAHVTDLAAALPLAHWDERARALAARFWPGPLTIVLPRKASAPLSPLACSGLATVALRAPDHPVAQRLLAATGLPVVAPSANPSGGVSPTTAHHVAETLGRHIEMIIDGGRCEVGVESTVVDLTGQAPRLLRPGGVTREDIETVIGPLAGIAAGPMRSPGQLSSHYAPRRPVRLEAAGVAGDEALLAFGTSPLEGAVRSLNLSPCGDLDEAAANLFAMLRVLDGDDVRAIAVMPVPRHGLGEAINDRLRRAAAPRPLAQEHQKGLAEPISASAGSMPGSLRRHGAIACS